MRAAVAMAHGAGHPLTDYLHSAIIEAAQYAEDGGRAGLPARPGRRPRGTAPKLIAVFYTAAKQEHERTKTQLERAGSSIPAVGLAALEAFVAAGGVWMDVRLPWRCPAPAGRSQAA